MQRNQTKKPVSQLWWETFDDEEIDSAKSIIQELGKTLHSVAVRAMIDYAEEHIRRESRNDTLTTH